MEKRIQQPLVFSEIELPLMAQDLQRTDHVQNAAYLAQRGNIVGKKIRKRFPLMREFIAWDGEGHSPDAFSHQYMLFGCSKGNSVHDWSLPTTVCFELMLAVETLYPDAYHVWFSGNYDVNMILRDMPIEKVDELHATGQTDWLNYRVKYMKGKSFSVTSRGVTCRIDDVFSYFHTSFINAIEEYLGKDAPGLDIVKQGKGGRATFTYEDLSHVSVYMEHELRLLVRLMNRLRDYLAQIDVITHRWHGPGAVASAILKRRGFAGVPNSVTKVAAEYAYSGGRFEQYMLGRANAPVHVYDIRSAYPYALSRVPNLQTANWDRVERPRSIHPYGLYYVSKPMTRGMESEWPQPLFWRATNGAVYYPRKTTGWYWGVELTGITNRLASVQGLTVKHGLVPLAKNNDAPFGWLADYYRQRAQWKREGKPAQLALKLAMNSIYGKLAQQLGWTFNKDGSIRFPKYHQIEYAGVATATARGMIYQAMSRKPWAIVACETDSVMSLEPLPLLIGEELGQWEHTQYDDVIYLQSGVYWARTNDGWKTRSRGFGRTALTVADVMAWCEHHPYGSGITENLVVYQNRFNTMGTSRHTPAWRTWTMQARELTPGLAGKRVHMSDGCKACENERSYADALHRLILPPSLDSSLVSAKFPLRWEGKSVAHEYFDDEEEWITEDDV